MPHRRLSKMPSLEPWDEIHRTIGRHEGMLESHGDRLDRMEDRMEKPRLKPQDLLPWLPGLLILGLVALGKMTVAEAVQHLSGSGP